MKKVWKWVIGIAIGLVVLAVLVGAGFLVWGNMHVYHGVAQLNRGFEQRGPGMMPYGGFGYQLRGPSMMGYRMFPFGGIHWRVDDAWIHRSRCPWNSMAGGTHSYIKCGCLQLCRPGCNFRTDPCWSAHPL